MADFIFGKNPVLEAMKSGRSIHKLWVLESAKKSSLAPILARAREQNITVQYTHRGKLDQLAAHSNHQGVVAQVAAHEYVEWQDILAGAQESQEAPFLIILDGIEDPHNLGSILRTADAAGAHGVIIPARRSAGLTETAAKASAGAVEYVPVAKVSNIANTIDRLKEQGIWIIGSDAGADSDYREIDYTVPLALVIGNEGKGISRLVREKCDLIVRLPMRGNVSSLNASVAAALMLYEVLRKRTPVKKDRHG